MGAALPPVTLGRLSLRGRAADLPGARARLLADLDRADWPVTGADEVVLLRSLAVRGSADQLAARAAHQAAAQARQALDGWSASAGDAAAVRFDSSAAMAACLLRDLLCGQAGRCWYWQHRQADVLGRPLTLALAVVLGERPLALPELLGCLGERAPAAWAGLWSTLDDGAARQVLDAVAASTGWVLGQPRGPAADGAAWQTLRDAPAALRRDHRQLAASLTRWQRDPPAGAVPTAAMLAALYLMWRHQPAVLGRSGAGARHLGLLAAALVQTPSQGEGEGEGDAREHARDRHAGDARASDVVADTAASPARATRAVSDQADRAAGWRAAADAHAGAAADAQAGAPTGANGAGQARHPARQAMPSDGPPSPSNTHDAAGPPSTPVDAAPPVRAAATRPQPAALASVDPSADPHRDALAGPGDAHDFVTASGGLFYLLNILKLRGAQALLVPGAADPADAATSAHGWQAPGCGWRWLARLGLALGITLDAPLRHFLARQAGLDEADELDHLPPLPGEDRLIALGQARVGPALWAAPSTWARPARVLATRSHVDVHLRSADVTLALRRTGLDIDPGWLPWLGRVVHLHYASALAPRDHPP